jgi:hypothetical protein
MYIYIVEEEILFVLGGRACVSLYADSAFIPLGGDNGLGVGVRLCDELCERL